jgi:hypothetical protein
MDLSFFRFGSKQGQKKIFFDNSDKESIISGTIYAKDQ